MDVVAITSWNDPIRVAARAANRRIVEDYLSRVDEGRLTRYKLFTPDGVGGLWTNDTLAPIVCSGHSSLKAHGEWSLQCFPDWHWYNISIHETGDPDMFWAECDGRGVIRFEGYPEGIYENHFLHSFEFEDGLIKRQREFMNPFAQLQSLGIAIPKLIRAGIPE